MFNVTITNNGIDTLIHGQGVKLSSGKIVKGINSIDSFTFTMLPNNPGISLLHEFTTIVKVHNERKDRDEFVGRVLYTEDEMTNNGNISKTVTCESLLGYLCDSQQMYVAEKNWTVSELLTHLIACHNSQVEEHKQFKVGTITAKDNNDNLYLGVPRENTWDALNTRLIEKIGGEFQYRIEEDGLYLDYLSEIGETKETEIALSYNMKAITREKDPSSFVTRLIPLGAKLGEDTEERLDITSVNGGKNYIDDADLIAVYGIHVGIQEWDDVKTATALLTKGRKWLTANNRVQVKYSITALDLSRIGLAYDDFVIGNYHPIKNVLLKIDDTARIIKQTIDVCNEVDSVFEVGDNFKTLSELQIEAQRAQAQNIAILEKTTKELGSGVTQTQQDLNALVERVDNIAGIFFYIRYSAFADGTDMTEEPMSTTAYMGTCSTNSATAPTDKGAYTWCRIVGADGATGSVGVGIDTITEEYYHSTSATSLSGGSWSTTAPTWADGRYIWTRSIISYTDGSSLETSPICVSGRKGETGSQGIQGEKGEKGEKGDRGEQGIQGVQGEQGEKGDKGDKGDTGAQGVKGDKGDTGATGNGVSSITTQFYLSTSKTTQTGGSWVTSMPTWSSGTYLWTRSKITYTNGSTAYTSPQCDSAWEATTALDTKLNQNEVFNRLTNNGELQGLYMLNGQLYINGQYVEFVGATIGGWKITDAGLKKDVTMADGTEMRVLLQPPMESAGGNTWILSCQQKIDGAYYGKFVLKADGSAWFGGGSVKIDSSGNIDFKNRMLLTYDGTIIWKSTTGGDYPAQITRQSDGSVTFTIGEPTGENVKITKNRIYGLTTPTSDLDATNKAYVDTADKTLTLTGTNIAWDGTDWGMGTRQYYYEGADTAALNLPYSHVVVIVSKQRGGNRGIAMAYQWANGYRIWMNRLHNDGSGTWSGWEYVGCGGHNTLASQGSKTSGNAWSLSTTTLKDYKNLLFTLKDNYNRVSSTSIPISLISTTSTVYGLNPLFGGGGDTHKGWGDVTIVKSGTTVSITYNTRVQDAVSISNCTLYLER